MIYKVNYVCPDDDISIAKRYLKGFFVITTLYSLCGNKKK